LNLRQLKTLARFLDQGSFAGVADSIGLSHSAVSIQMKQLENDLGVELFDRCSKPPVLTPMGAEIAILGGNILQQIDKIRMVATGQNIASLVSIGFVPSTLQTLLPLILNKLSARYPKLRVTVKSGLSGELAMAVTRKELEFAILTSPIEEMSDLRVTEFASEPLYVVGPQTKSAISSEIELIRSMPFIAFSKKTWLGQRIAARLQARGIYVDEIMEVDSIDAIEQLVADGFGVSIIPQRLHAAKLSDSLVQIPFCKPVETRKLVLIRHAVKPKTQIDVAIQEIVAKLSL